MIFIKIDLPTVYPNFLRVSLCIYHILLYVQSHFAVIRVPDCLPAALEHIIATQAEVRPLLCHHTYVIHCNTNAVIGYLVVSSC